MERRGRLMLALVAGMIVRFGDGGVFRLGAGFDSCGGFRLSVEVILS